MQPPTAPPRDALTVAQVTTLIRDAPAIEVGAGLELLDMNLSVLADITDDLTRGTVSRSAYATLHGTCALGITRQLDWGRAIVRPYMLVSSSSLSARFNLGAYFTATPEVDVGTTPIERAVAGYDILHALSDKVGDSYAVDSGAGYLNAVVTILGQRGYTRYVVDQTAAASVLPSSRVWPLDDHTTWLDICNDLLGAVGYQGIWSDWDGQLRLHQYQSPAARLPEWAYDTNLNTSMLEPPRKVLRDYFNAPNRWVAYRSNNIDGPPPVEGNGRYTYVNQFVGDTSVEARGGRTITRVLPLDAADQAGLIGQAQSSIDADMRVDTKLRMSTAPNPLHWHFDRFTLDDPQIGPQANVLGTQWTLPLNGDSMTHEWTVL